MAAAGHATFVGTFTMASVLEIIRTSLFERCCTALQQATNYSDFRLQTVGVINPAHQCTPFQGILWDCWPSLLGHHPRPNICIHFQLLNPQPWRCYSGQLRTQTINECITIRPTIRITGTVITWILPHLSNLLRKLASVEKLIRLEGSKTNQIKWPWNKSNIETKIVEYNNVS